MSFATKQRILLGIAVLMMFIPTMLYSAGMLGRAPLFEGDVRQELTCLTCDGLGRNAQNESCPTCRGRGVADYIIPGPNRPLQLVGTIHDVKGQPVADAEISARQAEGDDTSIILHSNKNGQFGLKLPPGSYVVKIDAVDKGSVQETVLVTTHPEPVPAKGMETLHVMEQTFVLPK